MSKSNIDKILNAIDSDSDIKNKPNTQSVQQQNNNFNKTIDQQKSVQYVKPISDNKDNVNNQIKSFSSKLDLNDQSNNIEYDDIEVSNGIKIKKHVHSIIHEINKKTVIKTMSKDKQSFLKNFNIKVIGIGGAGNNIVKYMKTTQQWPDFVQIIALNTDFVALSNMGNLDDIFILGAKELDGNGSGGDPNVGMMAAEADSEIIKEMLKGTDILILAAGLGKGTGTGATPVIAKIAQELGILTIGLFNLPSIGAEGNKIYSNALSGLQKLSYLCNGLTTVNNDKIISLDRERTSIKKAYQGANKYINDIIVELINIVVKPSDINIDFADVRNFFEDKNGFLFLKIELNDYSKDSIKEAIENAIKSGFSEVNIKDSQKALLNFKLNENVPSVILENARSALKEIVEANNINIVHGISYNDNFEGAEINILLIGSFELGGLEEEYVTYKALPTDGEKILSTSSIDLDELEDDVDFDQNLSTERLDSFLESGNKSSNYFNTDSKQQTRSIEEMYDKFLHSENNNQYDSKNRDDDSFDRVSNDNLKKEPKKRAFPFFWRKKEEDTY